MKAKGGAIVNVASTLGVRVGSGFAAYAASKAAVRAITRSTALHCAEQGCDIRCSAVLPGATDTPMFEEYLASAGKRDAARAAYAAAHPLGRVGRPEDVAAAIFVPRLCGGGLRDGGRASCRRRPPRVRPES